MALALARLFFVPFDFALNLDEVKVGFPVVFFVLVLSVEWRCIAPRRLRI